MIRDNAALAAAQWEARTLRQVPWATARALTDAAFAARAAVRAEMVRVFDRPTPYTLGAFAVTPARKERLEATLATKEHLGGHYLAVQETGGSRPAKRIETLIAAANRYQSLSVAGIVPSAAARKDRYGNWNRGEINVILSNLGAQSDPWANTTAQSRRRAGRKVDYFVPDPGSTLPRHIYRRAVVGGWTHLAVVGLLLARPPQYQPRFAWRSVADRAGRAAFPAAFAARLKAATAAV